MKKVLTTCGYCGCGCNLYLTVEGGRITGVLPKPDHPVSQGMLCSKGWQGHGFARHPDRLDQPLLRQEDGTLKGVSWSEAYRAIAEHLRAVLRTHGPDKFAMLASARCTNEENYLAAKLTRDRFSEYRSLRAPLTQPHRSRSGYSVRVRGGHQRP